MNWLKLELNLMIMTMSKDIKNNYWKDTKDGRKYIRDLKDYHLIGHSFISEIERSKSNNSRCHSCGKRIGKNTLRGIQTRLYEGIKKFNMRFVHCSDCTIRLLGERIKELMSVRKLMKNRKRTRKSSYQNQNDLQLKDDMLNKLLDDNDNDKRGVF